MADIAYESPVTDQETVTVPTWVVDMDRVTFGSGILAIENEISDFTESYVLS